MLYIFVQIASPQMNGWELSIQRIVDWKTFALVLEELKSGAYKDPRILHVVESWEVAQEWDLMADSLNLLIYIFNKVLPVEF